MSKGNALWLLGLNVSHMAFSCKKPFLAMFKEKKKRALKWGLVQALALLL